MLPGLRLRQVRERLGLTYRDVERISFELAARRGRPEFVLHLSRLADIENHNVVPSLHKLYTLAVVYHLKPLELFSWYDVPVGECFEDGVNFPSPQTHLIAPPSSMKVPLRFDPAFDPRRTDYLSRMVERPPLRRRPCSIRSSKASYPCAACTSSALPPILGA